MKNERIIEVVAEQLNKHEFPKEIRVSYYKHGNGYGVAIRWPVGWAPGIEHLPQFREWAWGESCRVYGIQGEARIRKVVDDLAERCKRRM